MTATRTSARPDTTTLATVRAALDELPDGDTLALIYSTATTAEAALVCAHARARGRHVLLHRLRETDAAAVGRCLRELPPVATVVLSCHRLAGVPTGGRPVLQLAGPTTLWRRADPQPPPTTTLRLDGELHVTVAPPWRTDEGTTDGGIHVRPAGAVEATVVRADGRFVADGAFDINRPVSLDRRLADRPVTVTVEDSRVVDLRCPDPVLQRLLDRVVGTHRVDRVETLRLGRHDGGVPFQAVPGPVNDCRSGVTLRLTVDPVRAYSPASADLRLDLIATLREGQP